MPQLTIKLESVLGPNLTLFATLPWHPVNTYQFMEADPLVVPQDSHPEAVLTKISIPSDWQRQ